MINHYRFVTVVGLSRRDTDQDLGSCEVGSTDAGASNIYQLRKDPDSTFSVAVTTGPCAAAPRRGAMGFTTEADAKAWIRADKNRARQRPRPQLRSRSERGGVEPVGKENPA
jgi:hypothetical protein